MLDIPAIDLITLIYELQIRRCLSLVYNGPSGDLKFEHHSTLHSAHHMMVLRNGSQGIWWCRSDGGTDTGVSRFPLCCIIHIFTSSFASRAVATEKLRISRFSPSR